MNERAPPSRGGGRSAGGLPQLVGGRAGSHSSHAAMAWPWSPFFSSDVCMMYVMSTDESDITSPWPSAPKSTIEGQFISAPPVHHLRPLRHTPTQPLHT